MKRGSVASSGRPSAATRIGNCFVVVDHREVEPAAVARAIHVAGRGQQFRARRARRDGGAGQPRLHQERVRPQPVREQRRRHQPALAGGLALIEAGDDRRIERDAAGMVAHARDRARRRRGRIGAHLVHQARARPVGGGVEAGLVGLLALFAVGGERRIDQLRIARAEILVADLHAAAYRQRQVGDEHVGLVDQPVQHAKPLRRLQVERDAALVARAVHPGVVDVALRRAGVRVQRAVGVAFAGRLDLDDVGAEVRQHRGGGRRGDEARAVDDLQSCKELIGHRCFSLLLLSWTARVSSRPPSRRAAS